MIPILAVALMIITNKKDLMGRYKNGWFTNTVLVLLTLVALYFTFLVNLPDLLRNLGIL